MSPTLFLLRAFAVLLVPLLVAPAVVSLDPGPSERRSTSARALQAAGQAVEVFDPLVPLPDLTAHGPPAVEGTLPALAGDGPVAAAPASDAGTSDAAADRPASDDTGAESAKQKVAGKTVKKPSGATPQRKGAPGGGEKKAADETTNDKNQTKSRAAKKEKAAQAASAKAKKKANRAKAAKKKAAAAPPANPRTLYLAVGHGRAPNDKWQPGAVHPSTGAHETHAAQIMADAMTEILRESPHVELHNEGGNHPNVLGSAADANTLAVDDCIELHQDTAAAPPGVFAHWFTGATAAHQLANRLVDAVANHGIPVRHDWHRARPGLYWVRKTECRAVLMEIGRVGDFSTEQLRAYGQSMAKAYLADITGR